MEWFISSLGEEVRTGGEITSFDRYIADPGIAGDFDSLWDAPITDLDASIRFAQLINSYCICMQGEDILTRGIPPNATVAYDDANMTFAGPLGDSDPNSPFPTWRASNVLRNTGSQIWSTEGTKPMHKEVIVSIKDGSPSSVLHQ